MGRTLRFTPEEIKKGEKGVSAVQIQFSQGTYQAEFEEKKKRYWPFLQLSDQGEILDSFCSCSEAKMPCPHIVAAYLKIFNQQKLPLHVRFRSSFWHQLCLMEGKRQEWSTASLKRAGGVYSARSETGKKLFSIEAASVSAKSRLKALLFDRSIETEETSLKFSNLPPEELKLWKEGRPSLGLQYELSFWSDLAKWLMALQEEGAPYQIEWVHSQEPLPSWVHIRFRSLKLSFYIASVHWPQLIPSLASVRSPLSVHEFQHYTLKGVHYDEARRSFHIEKEPLGGMKEQLAEGIEVGEWLYVPTRGFFPKELDRVFEEEEIPFERAGALLSHYPALLQKYLVGVSLHLEGIQAQYALSFDAEENLQIVCYAFEKGDLTGEGAVYFGSWIYLKTKGFYRLEGQLFPGIEKRVLKSQMDAFINRHPAWLGGFEGFQTHVYRFESHLHFRTLPEGDLQFYALIEMWDPAFGVIDFGEWVYVQGRGFFAKKVGKGTGLIEPNAHIPKAQVDSFIRLHQEELEQVRGFFAHKSPLERSGLDLFLNHERQVVVRPHFEWKEAYKGVAVQIFEEHTYVPGEGFCAIPPEYRVPEAYLQEKTIASKEEPYFVLHELETLKSCTLSIEKPLRKPTSLELKVIKIEQNPRVQTPEWLLEAVFETEIGEVGLFPVWEALQEGRYYLFSPAGCLLLKQPRFNWLKVVTKRQWLKGGEVLRLTTLQWLRLSAFESVEIEDPLFVMQQMGGDHPLDLTGFISSLRPYQETGVHWLWFLFRAGLSGLLCDEMGLGKTHQAMGLMAALNNHTQEGSSLQLVVCPTSVVYHWQALLERFLPGAKVIVFYGALRSLPELSHQRCILLTSYGTLRSDIELLSQVEFQLAVFDELQIAKNSRSQTHKALRKIRATMRLGLSGTPIENRLLELKALFDVVIPGYLPQESQFKELFVTPIERYQDKEKKGLLSRLVKPFILRRKKSEVLLELPEKIEEIAYCDLSEEQKELYQQSCKLHREVLIRDLESGDKAVPYLHVFALLSSLKQICDHPCLITKEYAHFQKHRSGKWDLFVELLQEIRDSGQKVVVFSQYLDMLDLMQVYLNEQEIGYTGVRGSTRDRKERIEKFQTDPECVVFLASLQAVGVGVDLTAASVVIHYDRWWNPARENQATDRVHRMGQNRGVQVFKMVTKGTLEEHIHNLIEKKKTLMEGVIGFDEQDQIKGLNREELLSLLQQIGQDGQ